MDDVNTNNLQLCVVCLCTNSNVYSVICEIKDFVTLIYTFKFICIDITRYDVIQCIELVNCSIVIMKYSVTHWLLAFINHMASDGTYVMFLYEHYKQLVAFKSPGGAKSYN